MIVVWGGNRMIDCVALLSWQDQIVLGIADAKPLKVTFSVPRSISEGSQSLEIVENQIVAPRPKPRELSVSWSPDALTVLWKDVPIITALEIEPEPLNPSHRRVVLRTDLRPLGMNIFDDGAGIHVGGSVIARTAFSHCSTAIRLS